WEGLSEQFDLLCGQFRLAKKHTRDVAAWSREAFDITALDRIVIDRNHDYWNEAACTDNGLQRNFRSVGDDQIGLRKHQFGSCDKRSARIIYPLIFDDEILSLLESSLSQVG